MIQALSKYLSSVTRSYCLYLLLFLPVFALAQEILAPPSLGQETKGVPAAIEKTTNEQSTPTGEVAEESQQEKANHGLLGRTQINEQRRENGQIYRIELKHSSGSTQYIEENDSDGKLESTSNDIEETPNLAKWRIGSW